MKTSNINLITEEFKQILKQLEANLPTSDKYLAVQKSNNNKTKYISKSQVKAVRYGK